METPIPEPMRTATQAEKREKKAIQVSLHGHTWPVYPMKCRDKLIFRVIHRVNGERRPKNFSSLAAAKADAKSLIREYCHRGDSKIHLTEDDKLDWKAATGIL